MNEQKNYNKKPTKSNPPFYYIEGKGWYVDTKVKVDGVFKHLKRGYWPSLSVAKSEFACLADKMQGSVIERCKTPWSDFCEDYLAFRRTQVKGASLATEKRWIAHIQREINPKTSGECFNRNVAAKFQRAVMALDVNRDSKNKIIAAYLHMAKFAYQRDYMENDRDYKYVEAEVRKIAASEEDSGKRFEKRVLSVDEENALLGAIENPVDKMLVLTLFSTGLRIGEALALTPADFDPLECEVSVSKTVSVDEDGNRRVYKRTKTPLGKRKIPVSTEYLNAMAEYVTTMAIGKDKLVFPAFSTGVSVMDATAFRRRLENYCDKAGIKKVTPHCLRHTYATRLSGRCYTDADRQARAYLLGHSVTVDEQVYTAHNQLETAKILLRNGD